MNPEKELVVAVSSFFKPTVFDRVDFIEAVLLPCFRSSLAEEQKSFRRPGVTEASVTGSGKRG